MICMELVDSIGVKKGGRDDYFESGWQGVVNSGMDSDCDSWDIG